MFLSGAGLVSRLKVFYYPTIRELTSTTDVPFNRLNQELFTFYISVAADNHELKPAAALMLNLALGILAEGKSKHPLMLLTLPLPAEWLPTTLPPRSSFGGKACNEIGLL